METNILSIEDILTERGLNWKVRTEGLRTESGIYVNDHIAVVREDNNDVLAINGDGYNSYQNHELMEMMFRISKQSGISIHSGGMFDGGRKVFIQLKGKDLKLGTDKIEGFFTSINSFDGSTALGWGNYNNTISCKNTFWAGYAGLSNKVRHTANMRPKIEELLKQLEIAVAREEEIFATIKKMSEVKIDDKVRQLVTNRLFDLKNEDKLADISTAKRNKMDRFYFDLTTELKDKEETLWGLFSGVTRYTTHSMKNGKDNTEGKMFGAIGNKERAIWHTLAEMVK